MRRAALSPKFLRSLVEARIQFLGLFVELLEQIVVQERVTLDNQQLFRTAQALNQTLMIDAADL